MPPLTIIAHRGWSGKYPENTLLAFREAIALGVDAIEFDVHQSKDGELVVLHDGDVSRTTNGRGQVSQLTLAELRALDAGRGERIPLLREVLELGRGKVDFHLEIKALGLETKIMTILEDLGVLDRTYLSSFLHATVKQFKVLCPRSRVATLEPPAIAATKTQQLKLAQRFIKNAQGVGAMAVHPNFVNITRVIVDALHEADLRVNSYTVDAKSRLERFMKLGVDGVFTNKPDILLPIARKFAGV